MKVVAYGHLVYFVRFFRGCGDKNPIICFGLYMYDVYIIFSGQLQVPLQPNMKLH